MKKVWKIHYFPWFLLVPTTIATISERVRLRAVCHVLGRAQRKRDTYCQLLDNLRGPFHRVWCHVPDRTIPSKRFPLERPLVPRKLSQFHQTRPYLSVTNLDRNFNYEKQYEWFLRKLNIFQRPKLIFKRVNQKTKFHVILSASRKHRTLPSVRNNAIFIFF